MYNPTFRPGVPAQVTETDKAEAIGLRDVARFVRSSLSTILGCIAIFLALGIVFCLVVTPSYTSGAQVLLEPNQAPPMLLESSRSSATSETEAGRIESQIQVIKSDQIAQDVIRKLDLLNDSEFSVPESKAPFYAPLLALLKPAKVDTGDPESARMSFAVDNFANRLAVRRIGQSFVVEIQFRSEDPVKANRITNAIVDAFINGDLASKADNARRGGEWMTERLNELREQVTASRGSLERFKGSSDVQNASDRTVKFLQLESIAQTQSRLYDAFLQRSLETVQRITYPVPDARVIASATKPQARSFPKVGLVLAFAGLLGSATGVIVALGRRSADRRIRSIKAITAATNAPVIGVIAAADGRRIAPQRWKRPLSKAASVPAAGAGWVGNDFRALKVTLSSALIGGSTKRLGVTSPEKGEGKTTLVKGLATLLAFSGSKVLLVDLCSEDPALSRMMAPEARLGVSEFLKDPRILASAIVRQADVENLYLLPLGRAAEPASPAEQFAALHHLAELEALDRAFDLIIFDLPGASVSPDALAMAPLLNAVIVVAEYNRTTIDALETCVADLRGSRAEIFGVILNKADLREMNA